MANEVVIYTDESDRTGEYYSNFYGGILVRSKDLERAADRLLTYKSRRASRTMPKHRLYQHIPIRIRAIYPLGLSACPQWN